MGQAVSKSVREERCRSGVQVGVFRTTPEQVLCDNIAKGSGEGLCNEAVTGADTARGSDSSPSKPAGRGFLFTYFSSEKTLREVPSNPESEIPEQVHSVQTFQDGYNFLHHKAVDPRMLHGIPGPKGCLPSYTNSSGIAAVPAPGIEGREFGMAPPIQGSAVRTLVLSQGLYEDYGRGFGTPEIEGDSSRSLSGRPFVFCRLQGAGPSQSPEGPVSPRGPGVASKPREVNPDPLTGNEISGVYIKFDSPESFPAVGKTGKVTASCTADTEQPDSLSQDGYGSSGPAYGSNPGCSVGQVPFQTPSEGGSVKLVPSGSFGKTAKNFVKDEKGSLVVERPGKPLKGPGVDLSCGQAPYYRRKCLGLGSPSGWSDISGGLVQTGSSKIIQLEGVEGDLSGFSGISAEFERPPCSGVVRQHNSGYLHYEARGNQKQELDGAGQSVVSLGRTEHSLTIGSASEGLSEFVCGPPKQAQIARGRMESESGSVPDDLRGLGGSTGRPFCQPAELKGGQILFSSPSRCSNRVGCIRSPLALPAVLCLSPLSSNSTSTEEIQGRKDRLNTSHSFLAKKALVRGSSKPSLEAPMEVTTQKRSVIPGDSKSSRSGTPAANRLVSEEDLLKAKGLSDKVVKTLLSSRKAVTQAIYMKVWKKFNSWCSSRELKVKSTVSVLEFLHEGMEKGLAASTLKTQVAALSVFFEKTLSKETLISRFFRALA
ncbi:uncharacterized protein LOC143933797 [Lithobates pipiens]